MQSERSRSESRVVAGGGLNTPPPVARRQIGIFSELLAGGIAGAVSKTCTAPLTRLSILFQIMVLLTYSKMQSERLRLESRVVAGGGLNTPPPVARRQIGTFSELLAGGIAGAVSKTSRRCSTYDKVQGMHSYASTLEKASIWGEASRIVREEGLRAFWKGNLVTTVHRFPYSSICFYAFESYKNLLLAASGVEVQGDNKSAGVCMRLICGGLAGVTAASVTYPLDLVRTRLTTQINVIYYRGIMHALSTIIKEEGPIGLYRGLGTTLLVRLHENAITLQIQEFDLYLDFRPTDSTALVSLACGSVSGIAASTVYPLDLLRRRMQLDGVGGRPRVYKTGIFGTLKHIVGTEGFCGLYRGILPEYYKVVPSVGIVFMTYEKMKQVLSSDPVEVD